MARGAAHEPRSVDRLTQAQRVLGLGPLLVYACFHLWQHWPALQGRELWVDRALVWQPGWLVGSLVLGAIAAHAVLALRALRQRRRGVAADPAETRDSLAGFQTFTGLLVAGFVIIHVLQLWPPASGPHATPRDAYDVLWTTLGTPATLVAYVLGVTALAFHLATGIAGAAERALPSLSRRGLRYAAGLFGLLIWLAYLQLVGRFALGERLLPGLASPPGVAASAPGALRPSR